MTIERRNKGTSALASLARPGHAVLRIGAGLLFMQHGAQKLFGLLGGMDGSGATAPLASLMGVAGVIEFFGGLLLVVGLFARPVALLAAGQMAGAWFIAHAPQGWVPILNGGELALLFMVVWVYVAASGAGPLSVDAVLARRRAATGPETARRVIQPEPAAAPARRREVA
jgi:putative oxidoreductase